MKTPAPKSATLSAFLGLGADGSARPDVLEVIDLGDAATRAAFSRLASALRDEDEGAVESALDDISDGASVVLGAIGAAQDEKLAGIIGAKVVTLDVDDEGPRSWACGSCPGGRT